MNVGTEKSITEGSSVFTQGHVQIPATAPHKMEFVAACANQGLSLVVDLLQKYSMLVIVREFASHRLQLNG